MCNANTSAHNASSLSFFTNLDSLNFNRALSNQGCSPGSWLGIQSKKWWSKDAETPTFPIIIPLHWPMSSRVQVLILTWSTHSIQVSQTQLLTEACVQVSIPKMGGCFAIHILRRQCNERKLCTPNYTVKMATVWCRFTVI